MPVNFLAGDLGGTKTLLALYSWDGKPTQLFKKRFLSLEWSSPGEMIRQFISEIPAGLEKINYGCIAVAGPVKNGSAKITNLSWEIDEEMIIKASGLKKIELINDFSVLIYGLPFLSSKQQKLIQGETLISPLNGMVAILGAGTGLGIARGLMTQEGITVLPSEGGHREFAPRTESEWQ